MLSFWVDSSDSPLSVLDDMFISSELNGNINLLSPYQINFQTEEKVHMKEERFEFEDGNLLWNLGTFEVIWFAFTSTKKKFPLEIKSLYKKKIPCCDVILKMQRCRLQGYGFEEIVNNQNGVLKFYRWTREKEKENFLFFFSSWQIFRLFVTIFEFVSSYHRFTLVLIFICEILLLHCSKEEARWISTVIRTEMKRKKLGSAWILWIVLPTTASLL